MPNTSKTNALSYSHQIFQQKPVLKADVHNSSHSEQKIAAIFKSTNKESSKPRKLRGKYTKHPLLIKEVALAEVYSGASIYQISKKYGIKYNTLKNWHTLLKNWMKPTDPKLLYHEFFALQDAKNLTHTLLVNFCLGYFSTIKTK